jgi:hypothetical protein
MSADSGPPGLAPGSTLTTAMLSPCVGGLVRTWTDTASQLWSVPDDVLPQAMGVGRLARTLREENRFREVALLDEDSGTLLLQPRFPTTDADGRLTFDATALELQPAREPGDTSGQDLLDLLSRAVRYVADEDAFLLVEIGGWDAPPDPYCLFVVADGQSIVETSPAPHGSDVWPAPDSDAGATVNAPASPDTIAAAPAFIADACSRWGLSPWDLALTFGVKPTG